jgi:hypothetical protein
VQRFLQKRDEARDLTHAVFSGRALVLLCRMSARPRAVYVVVRLVHLPLGVTLTALGIPDVSNDLLYPAVQFVQRMGGIFWKSGPVISPWRVVGVVVVTVVVVGAVIIAVVLIGVVVVRVVIIATGSVGAVILRISSFRAPVLRTVLLVSTGSLCKPLLRSSCLALAARITFAGACGGVRWIFVQCHEHAGRQDRAKYEHGKCSAHDPLALGER